jgi:hypothetical protein
MAFGQLILTDQAQNFTSLAFSSSGVIQVTRVSFGNGFPGVSDYIPGFTNLKNKIQDGVIQGINSLVAGQLTVRTTLSSASAPSTYNINELAIFGTFAGGPETLLCYASTGANTGDLMAPTGGGPSLIKDYALLIVWQRAVSSSGLIQMNQIVNSHASSHFNTGTDPIPVATSIHTGMLPVSPSDGLQVPISTSPVTWAPALLVINSATTLYVTTGGNDSTGAFNDVTHPFASVAGALSKLSPYFITPSASVRIQVADGTYTSSVTSFTATHPQGSQISILGASYSTAITSVGNLAGSPGAYTLPITVASVANISVNGYIGVLPPGGSSVYPGVRGVFKVASIAGNVVTINLTNNITMPANQFAGITSGMVIPLTTIISTTGSTLDNVVISPNGNGIGQISNILFLGSGGAGSGISVTGVRTCNISYCGFVSNANGIAVNDGVCNVDHSWMTLNVNNGCFASNGAVLNLTTCGVCYNTGFGVHILQGGNSSCSDTHAVNNFQAGYAVGSVSQAALSICVVIWNGGAGGLVCNQVGFVISTGGTYTATAGGVDVSATALGYIWLSGPQTVGTHSPSSFNTLGPNGGYIQTP